MSLGRTITQDGALPGRGWLIREHIYPNLGSILLLHVEAKYSIRNIGLAWRAGPRVFGKKGRETDRRIQRRCVALGPIPTLAVLVGA